MTTNRGSQTSNDPKRSQALESDDGRVGANRHISSKDVAQLARLSQSTVSRVLNGHPSVSPDLRERVFRAMQDLRYVPNAAARSLITKQTRSIGLVISNITNPYFAELIEAATSRAADYGYSTFLSVVSVEARGAPGTPSAQIQMLTEQRVDGIILTSTLRGSDRALLETLDWLGESVPVVAVRPRRLHAADTIAVNYASGSRAAVRHLIEHGARRIAFIGGRPDSASEAAARSAFSATLRDAGIPLDPHLLTTGEFTYRSAYERMTALVASKSIFDSIFAPADAMALGCLDALADAGITVPGDVRVVGFDDIPAAALRSVQLTTVRGEAALVGRRAVELVLDRAQHGYRGVPRHVRVPAELIVRQSCGCRGPNAGAPTEDSHGRGRDVDAVSGER